ncbi:MAG: NFACT family protein [Spirochaetaceae bacterium]|jgi:predicted ribosome quality control (RQC) complex YloA/Tae2 family protein|nr:NFACT family protein [Spirochaetaceae bacterium]
MSLNWKEIDAVLEELALGGAFIQGVSQPSFDSVALLTYKPVAGARAVLFHLAPGVCRLHGTDQKIPPTKKPLRFMEFLRSRVKGARIIECSQPGKDRIVRLTCRRGDETLLLYARLWSGAANVIVTDGTGLVLDAMYRKPHRGEIPGGHFELPPESGASGKPEKDYAIRDFSGLACAAGARGLDLQTMTLNQKIDLWYSEYAGRLSREALLAQAQKLYTARKGRMEGALERLKAKRAEFLHAEQWKRQGDLILTWGHLGFDGGFLDCQDYDTGQPVSIQVDPKKTPQQNAADYYGRYKKALSGLEELESDIAASQRAILDLDALYGEVVREENPIKLRQLIASQNKPRQQVEKKRPGIAYGIDGWTILAGRDSSENDELLRRHVKGQDLWFHTRDWPGGYVFVKHRPGKTVPLDILLYAGNLALHHSKARQQGQADLYYTQVKYLRRAKNAPRGTVIPTQEKNLFIKRDSARLKRLEQCILQ